MAESFLADTNLDAMVRLIRDIFSLLVVLLNDVIDDCVDPASDTLELVEAF